MKKIYSSPTVNIVNVKLGNMIQASPEGFNNNVNETGVDGGVSLGKDRDSDYSGGMGSLW